MLHLSVSGGALTCSVCTAAGKGHPTWSSRPTLTWPHLSICPLQEVPIGHCGRATSQVPLCARAYPSPELILKPSDSRLPYLHPEWGASSRRRQGLVPGHQPGSARHLSQGWLTLELGVPSPTTVQGSGMQIQDQDCWARVLAPPPPCWVTWGWLLYLSVPQILHQCHQSP